MAGEVPGRGRLFDDDVDDVFAIEVAGLAEERFLAVIVVGSVIKELRTVAAVGLAGNGVGDGPAGEGPGALFNVILGVVELPVPAYTQGKQFQQHPSVVHVDRAFMA